MTKLPMSPTPDEPQADNGTRSRPHPDDAIRDGVIAALGRPPELYQVAVVPLWPSYYRVNVFVGVDPTALRVAHSFFVEATKGGLIVKSTPLITRLYS